MKAWSPNIAATSCAKASSFQGGNKKMGPSHPTGAAFMAAVSLLQHGQQEITLSLHLAGLMPGPRAASGRGVGVPTCPVTAQHLQTHSYSCWGPPLRVHSDVLGRNRVKPPHLRDVVVDVAFKKLQREEREGDTQKRQEMCAFHMLSSRLDMLGVAECSHSLKKFSWPTPGH